MREALHFAGIVSSKSPDASVKSVAMLLLFSKRGSDGSELCVPSPVGLNPV